MITTALFLVATAMADHATTFTAPAAYLSGGSYVAHVDITSKDGGDMAIWRLQPAAFSVDGQALGKREGGNVHLAPGTHLQIDIDLGPALADAKGIGDKPFKLGYATEPQTIEVTSMTTAEKGLDFTKMPANELSKYQVVMETNRGTMTIEFWPDVAPEHVRNFLDLCYTGFYNGLTFHRVIPGFMIQGGDPTGTGTGSGPRKLKAEFSQKKHERGVLSMARSADPNSASCQFFIMHDAYPSLDGQYSAFGKVTSGIEAVDKIVNTPRGPNDKPKEPQTIVKATVVKAGK